MDEKAKTKGLEFVFGWKELAFLLIASVCVAVGLGFVENAPIKWFHMNYQFYGYPIVWRITQDYSIEYHFWNLLADIALWVAVVFMLTAIVKGISRKLES